ncbi:MAG: YlcI/YnfO family protein [Candidatus Onthomonas sp.]
MKKFKIPSIPPTTSKSIRFPNDMIDEVEHWIQGKDCTFSAFVVEAVRVALDNLQEEAENEPASKQP